MSLKAYALTTVARLKNYLDISSSDDDTILEILVNATTEWIENHCDRRFKKTDYTQELIDSDGGNTLFLKNYPVDDSETFTLEIRTTSQNEDDWDTVDSEDYFVDYEGGMIQLVENGKWAKGLKKFRCTYTAGYDFDNTTTYLGDTEAGDLELAVWKLCAAVYNQRRGDPNVEYEKIGSYAVRFTKEALEKDPLIGSILAKYAKPDSVGWTTGPLY